MKWFAILIWFLMSFVTGAAIYLAIAPNPVLEAVVQMVTGTNVLDRCIRAERCRKVQQAPPKPGHYKIAPEGLDRS
jgi:hypothetical protein